MNLATSLMGYDERLLSRLRHAARQDLAWLGAVWLVAVVLLASSIGYTCWLAERSWLPAIITAVGSGLFLLNLLRVANSGGGRGAPGVVFGVVAVFFAQPAHLAWTWHAFDADVQEHRLALLASQTEAAAIAGSSMTGSDLTADDAVSSVHSYQARLAACPFLILRLERLWRDPYDVVRFTAAFVTLALLPALFAMTRARAALAEYDAARAQMAQALIARHDARARARTRQLLARWLPQAGAS